ncbi:MAG: hypothetical protein M1839_004925 [Geoglossum umbratile]|nr:MAG: hypothetical protein M1839_004925 [Geoglossum umbratile]
MATAANQVHSPSTLLSTILRVTEKHIIPLTRASVADGDTFFGAAILSRLTLEPPLAVAINHTLESPLLHGEISCIQRFFSNAEPSRPSAHNCVFFATHEPCSLCLSGITWSGFKELYFLFTYDETRDLFSIPLDIEILEEVFRVRAPADTDETLAARPLYNKQNKFFTSKSLGELVDEVDDAAERERLKGEIGRVKEMYNEFIEMYQGITD